MSDALLPASAPPDSVVRRSVLGNGVVVVSERLPHARTVAFAVFTRQGSRDEQASENGLSHFLEHFVFRGTRAGERGEPSRSLREIAEETDRLGGDVDAWTDREATCYSVAAAADLLPRATRLVMDLVARPTLEPSAFEMERAVIRQEIRGITEDAEEAAFELAAAGAWPRHPLGRPVQGTLRTLAAFTPESVERFWRRKHVGGNVLVAAAGLLDHDALLALVEGGLGDLPPGSPPPGPTAPKPRRSSRVARRQDLEQAHVVLSMPGVGAAAPEASAVSVLVGVLGQGTSSRLWQRVREDEGLAYDVSFSHSGHRDCGRLTFHAVTAPAQVHRALDIFDEETARLASEALPSAEFARCVEGLRAAAILGCESPGQRLSDLAWGELVHGRPVSLDERLSWLDAVTPEAVLEVARALLDGSNRCLVVVGPEGVAAT